MDGLRGKANVPHYRNAVINQFLDLLYSLSLNLDPCNTCLLHDHYRILKRLVSTDFVGAKWHVKDNQCIFSGSGNCFSKWNHFFQGHRNGGFVGQDRVACTIANQNEFDTRFVKNFGGLLIVGG